MSEEAEATPLDIAPAMRDPWLEAEAHAAALVKQRTGDDLTGHLLSRLQAHPGVQLLALGPSAGAVALDLAVLAPQAEMECLGVDAALCTLGEQRARAHGLNIRLAEADLNKLALEPAAYDLVFCHAVLHRVTALESLADQMRRALRRGGALVIVDVVTRSGYRMWPETRRIAEALWRTLPRKFRLNHTLYPAPLIDEAIWEPSPALEDIRQTRSEDILPVIEARFATEQFVPYFSLSRRFFDPTYGPNFDLAEPLDKALFDWIWELDVHYIAAGELRPEVFFGIYRPA